MARTLRRTFAGVITSERIHQWGTALLQIGVAIVLGATLIAEALVTKSTGAQLLLLSALCAGVIAVFQHACVPRLAPVAAAGSVLGTIVALAVPRISENRMGTAEILALLLILIWTVRRWDAPLGKWGTFGLVVAFELLPLRQAELREVVYSTFVLTIVLMGALGLGVYLRSVDINRQHALAEVRRRERMDLAGDLHDFVAHHVTGIVVQAQAAQYLNEGDAQQCRQAFVAVERAGMEALSSMRRLVLVLRNDEAAKTRPIGDLEQVRAMVEQFNVGGRYAWLHIAHEVEPRGLAPEVAATIHRIVQEALTNINKHGRAAVTVGVSIGRQDGDIEVTVRNDGRARKRSRLGRIGGGFGLAGLRERLDALNGSFRAGPLPEGGWEVAATIPMAGTTVESR